MILKDRNILKFAIPNKGRLKEPTMEFIQFLKEDFIIWYLNLLQFVMSDKKVNINSIKAALLMFSKKTII